MTHYEILGLPPTCTADDVKSAFRKLVKTAHPDVSKKPKAEAEAEFRALNMACDTLIDPAKRAQYDFSLQNGQTEAPSSLASVIMESMRDIFSTPAKRKASKKRRRKSTMSSIDVDDVPDGCEIADDGEELFG